MSGSTGYYMAEQRREYFRVQYPVLARPVLTAKSYQFEVIDVSEYGVRFRRNDVYAFEPGMQLVVWIRFSDGSEGEVDLGGELDGEVFEPLKDKRLFRAVTLHPEWHTVA